MVDTDLIVIGGGAAGLSAALFVTKNDLTATVFDTDKTWLHSAHLFNYLGIESIDGSAFLEKAREQATGFGADLVESKVTNVAQTQAGFTVTTDDGGEHTATYVVFATGTNRDLAADLGCDLTEDDTVAVDIDMETSVPDTYATGATARAEKWQAIISAGDGAAAALDILSKEKGERFHDFDTPDDA